MKETNRQRKALTSEVSKVQKTPIKYGFALTEEQKLVKEGVFEKDVTFILGNYGTGKTACATQIALDLVFRKDTAIDKIFITRPINFEATGFLKGDISEKMAIHMMPVKQNLYALYNKEKIDNMFKDGIIQILPIDYMKGITVTNGVMIVDEFEDITYEDFKTIITRLGKGSKLIFSGSEEQIGIKNSCLSKIKKLKDCELVNYHVLTTNHRNTIIQKVLDYIENQ